MNDIWFYMSFNNAILCGSFLNLRDMWEDAGVSYGQWWRLILRKEQENMEEGMNF